MPRLLTIHSDNEDVVLIGHHCRFRQHALASREDADKITAKLERIVRVRGPMGLRMAVDIDVTSISGHLEKSESNDAKSKLNGKLREEGTADLPIDVPKLDGHFDQVTARFDRVENDSGCFGNQKKEEARRGV